MFKRYLYSLVPVLFVVMAGCSDDDGPTDPGPPSDQTATTVWDETGGYWKSVVDATSRDHYTAFSFAQRDTTGFIAKMTETWDVAFRREVMKLNGGESGGGDVVGADLGETDYSAVTAADSTGAEWKTDEIGYAIDEWYMYNFQTHEITMTRNVYSMQDASGDHFVKLRVDSLSGDLSRGSMGTVHLTYFYQATPNDRDLSGATSTTSFDVNTGVAYFDFSTGATVSPSDPGNSLDWDLRFHDFVIAQNSGPSGTGGCAAFPAYQEINDPTDIVLFTSQPFGAPLFQDIPGSVLTDWYNYNGQTHELTSKDKVYLIRSEDKLYKMKVQGYYGDEGGGPISAIYTFIWNEL